MQISVCMHRQAARSRSSESTSGAAPALQPSCVFLRSVLAPAAAAALQREHMAVVLQQLHAVACAAGAPPPHHTNTNWPRQLRFMAPWPSPDMVQLGPQSCQTSDVESIIKSECTCDDSVRLVSAREQCQVTLSCRPRKALKG